MQILKRNFRYITIAIGIVMVWRGVWGLLDTFLLPNNQTLSFVISIALGVLILLIIDPKNRDLKELV